VTSRQASIAEESQETSFMWFYDLSSQQSSRSVEDSASSWSLHISW